MKAFTPTGYLLIISLFFFSFCDFSCTGVKLASVSGMDLVTGKQVDYNHQADEFVDETMKSNLTLDPVLWADLSFAAAIIGLSAFLVMAAAGRLDSGRWFHVVTSGIGAVCQLALMFHIKHLLAEQKDFELIHADFTWAYWMVFALFVLIFFTRLLSPFRLIKAPAPQPEPDFQKLGNIE
ncbi:MAG: hypothetical protein V4616_10905 [Bacteroidota bacterium]